MLQSEPIFFTIVNTCTNVLKSEAILQVNNSFMKNLDLTKFKKNFQLSSTDQQLGANSKKGNYSLHIAQDFNILILFSDIVFSDKETQLLQRVKFEISSFQFNGQYYEAKYFPRLDISQIHIPYKTYKSIPSLIGDHYKSQTSQPLIHNITIHIFSYSIMRYIMFFQMFDPSQQQKMQQLNPLYEMIHDQTSIDDLKELLFTNNLYIVVLMFVMSLAKTILEVFALKNQFKVWNQIEKNKGLSLKVLYTDLIFQTVFLLYLLDNESNIMVSLSTGIGILVNFWKIKKTIYIQQTSSFPFFTLKHYDWCRHHQRFDTQGVSYMYYALIVLLIGYLGYEVYHVNQISDMLTYSQVLEKLVFFLGMAGFIRMTPQLYINYKLKSVDHLPWRTLIYRFIETIIDDFYVFLVTTPLLHKIMVFREDVVFVCYLYQRMIYKTDPNRIGTASGMTINKNQLENKLDKNKQKSN